MADLNTISPDDPCIYVDNIHAPLTGFGTAAPEEVLDNSQNSSTGSSKHTLICCWLVCSISHI